MEIKCDGWRLIFPLTVFIAFPLVVFISNNLFELFIFSSNYMSMFVLCFLVSFYIFFSS
jgi:hypothetical protein